MRKGEEQPVVFISVTGLNQIEKYPIWVSKSLSVTDSISLEFITEDFDEPERVDAEFSETMIIEMIKLYKELKEF
jgi:hypothetical protein